MSSIFLSHAHEDKAFARKLATDLRLAGHAVWIDEAEINIGDSLIEKIREGLEQVDYVAAILSSASIDSPWVTRELDIASNREIEEGRVLVLPLLLENVVLPGFLKGKFYGDFTNADGYKEKLDLLLRAIGNSTPVNRPSPDELTNLHAELNSVRNAVTQHKAALETHQRIALSGKSEKLKAAITKANIKFPMHAPINVSHAFEVLGSTVTLDYLLWSIAKSERKGGHVLEAMLSMDNKWPLVESMLSAYDDLLSAAGD
ncbi:hypothetical protein GCM10027046_14940 [Uliginosibacterium flavum]|uniref:Toll/interleukin-1 receptor domain-containing protein n=1 Tax=Uliginosibacterium flavum TaxID=1396831 RepID=A0ABV2TN90_9RHOO